MDWACDRFVGWVEEAEFVELAVGEKAVWPVPCLAALGRRPSPPYWAARRDAVWKRTRRLICWSIWKRRTARPALSSFWNFRK